MDQAMNILGAIISGLFTLLAAFVPQYLENKKQRDEVLQDIRNRNYYSHSFWNLLFGVLFPLFCMFLIWTFMTVGLVGGITILKEQLPNAHEILPYLDVNRSVPVVRRFIFIELCLEVPTMFAAFLFTAKYLAHRSGRKAPWLIALAAVPILSVETFVSIKYQSEALTITDTIRNVTIFAVDYLAASAIGLAWARKKHKQFLISRIYGKLPESDRQAFFELAESLAGKPNEGRSVSSEFQQ